MTVTHHKSSNPFFGKLPSLSNTQEKLFDGQGTKQSVNVT